MAATGQAEVSDHSILLGKQGPRNTVFQPFNVVFETCWSGGYFSKSPWAVYTSVINAGFMTESETRVLARRQGWAK